MFLFNGILEENYYQIHTYLLWRIYGDKKMHMQLNMIFWYLEQVDLSKKGS